MENKQHDSEEVDVFELFRHIGRGFDKLGAVFLRFFNFLVRKIVAIGIIVLIGIVIGFFINRMVPQKYETVALVSSNFESTEYLYKYIAGIDSKFAELDEGFLAEMNLSKEEARPISLFISPIITVKGISPDMEDLSKVMEDSYNLTKEEIQDVLSISYDRHRITLVHTDQVQGEKLLEKIIDRIRTNTFFQKISQELHSSYARQIDSNIYVLSQIDSLLANYAQSIGSSGNVGKNLVYSDNSINLAGILEMRIDLQDKTADLRQKQIINETFIRVLSEGKTSAKERGIFENYIVLIPILLLAVFFLVHIGLWINRKAANLKP